MMVQLEEYYHVRSVIFRPDITFLERLTTIMDSYNCIHELVLQDFYKNMETIKQREELPRLLGGNNTEREQLELQVSKMIEMNELLKLSDESCFITIPFQRKEEILSIMTKPELHDYQTLTNLYIQENMKKSQKQKYKAL